MVLLADVRSVGVQGDGRTYGHPVVLRPVSSEDAMTADWTRLPYDVLAADLHAHHQRGPRGQPGRARRDEQAAGHHRVGVSAARRLTEGELQATVAPRPRPCGVSEHLWDLLEAYVGALPADEWQGHEPAALGTPTAWAMRGGRWVHVLLDTHVDRVGMVVVLTLTDGTVHGHRLLDLRRT